MVTWCGFGPVDDPGPCIVCGAPHSTCTSLGGVVSVPLRRPLNFVPPPVEEEPPEPVVVKTSEYRRAEHGPQRKRKRP